MRTRRGLLRALGAGGVGLALGGAGCAAPTRERPTDVVADAMFRQNRERRGFQSERVPGTVTRQWRIDGLNTGEHTAAKASPVLAPTGDVVVPGDNGELWALTPDGETRWRTTVTDATRGIHGTPAIANGTVYVGAYDGVLYAFDVATGERVWRTKLGDAIGSSPLYDDGTVYIAVEYVEPSGSVFGVDALDGEVTWVDDRPTDHPHSSIAIDRETGTLVVGSNDGFCYAWSFPDLEFAWKFDTDGPIKGPIATADGAAVFGSWDTRVYRVDLESGTVDWSFAADGKVMSGPGIAANTVYVGSHDTVLYALALDTGEERWRFDTDGWLIGCPAVTPDHVLVGSYDGHLYCVTRERGSQAGGEEVWRADATGWVTSTPLVHDGAVYYTDRATDERAGGIYKVAGV
ncbi:MAG: PQQ-binding-like beta-propeller repeat protein [Haloarculaceae archaeon]